MKPRQFLREQDWVAMAPTGPEPALSAVIAQVRAASRELYDDGPQPAPIAVTRVVNELPADPIGVEIADHRSRAGCLGTISGAVGDARDVTKGLAESQSAHQASCSFFTFAAND